MKICIAGWYFRPTFFRSVIASGYGRDAFVVKHREGGTCGIPSELYPNVGLEFGAYRQYVESHWDGHSDVLFCHDDTEIYSAAALREVATLKDMGVEQAYLFRDDYDELVNGGAHGRGVWISGAILAKLKADFPADMTNHGINIGKVAQAGIIEFHRRILECGKNTGVIAIVPHFYFGHRGRLYDKMFVYRKTQNPVPGGLVNVCE